MNLLHVVFQALPSNYKVKFLVSPIRIQFYFPSQFCHQLPHQLINLQVLQVDLVVVLSFTLVPLSIIHLLQVIYQCPHFTVNLWVRNQVPCRLVATIFSLYPRMRPAMILIPHLHRVTLLMTTCLPWMILNRLTNTKRLL